MDNKDIGFSTKAIHAGNVVDAQSGALSTPIYQSSTFVFDCCETGGKRFAGEDNGFIYTRLGNPTTAILENKIAALEGGEACAAAASGMGAISACLWSIASAGKHIIADETLYGCTFALLSHGMTRYGVEVTFTDLSDIENLKRSLRSNTVCIYLETPANPNLKITDIELISRTAHEFNQGITVVCDNTFASPALQKPLELGADVVVHSATKYLNGHGDVVAGFVVGRSDFISEVKMFGLKDMTGACLDPFAAWLILRGLKTLVLRVNRHCQSAAKVAQYLFENPKVQKVNYPGLPSHPGHSVAARQMSGFGGMISFEVKGGKEAGMRLCNALRLCTIAVSLGDAETLIEHPASMTHSAYSPTELEEAGISAGLIRLSVGLEDVEDIIADLDQAFEQI